MFTGAACWLIVSSLLGLIASIKFHSPTFLADCSWMTYGRVHPAATNALLYGFAVQSGLAVLLWVFARQGGTPLIHPFLIGGAAKIWNLGVLLGIAGIIRGSGSGFENLEMPRYAVCFLFASYLVIALVATITLHHRKERDLQPSQWFLFAALLWFPWIYSTANLLLLKFQVRGVTQAIIAWWFSANLITVWLALIGIAALFCIVPKLVKRPLYSSHYALFAFWTLLLFGTWTGVPFGAPTPAWMPAMSAVATLMLIIPAIAVAKNICGTIKGDCVALKSNPAGLFVQFAVPAFLLSTLMHCAASLPCLNAITNMTWFTVAQTHLQVYGFYAMSIFAAFYYLAPHVSGFAISAKFAKLHFILMALGVAVLVIPLAIAGIAQGLKLNDPSIPAVDVAKGTIPFLRAATTGELLILLGNVAFFANIAGLATLFAKKQFALCCADDSCDAKIAEVKA